MAWGTNELSTSLTLTSSFQTVQRSATDWEIALNPGESAFIIARFDPETTPVDELEFVLEGSNDGGTVFESDESSYGFTVPVTPDPHNFGFQFAGPRLFRIRAKQTGAVDTTNAVIFEVSKNGVNL